MVDGVSSNITQREFLHFAPANGFTAGAYNKILRGLEDEFQVIAIEKFGHDPRYPVDDNWTYLVKELINSVESKASEPVIGVGHSMGSIVTFLAAYQKPELFKQVIMLDPPLIYGMTAWIIGAAKKLRLINRIKEVNLAKNRRTRWSSAQEAEAYFKSKSLFTNFDPECLEDYVKYGTTPTENGVILSFDPNIEANIFRTTPHSIGRLKQDFGVPGAVILGQHTYTTTKFAIKRFVKRHKLLYQQLDYGSHLFPMEYPERTASLIKDAVVELK